MPLPRDFLIEMARKYALSPEQEETFVVCFGTDKTRLEITNELHITNSTLTTRLSHVYKKFRISGSGPGKEHKLLNWLTTEFRKSKASDSPTSNLSEDELNDLVEEVRSYWCEVIQDQCGTMRSLTMSQPIDVSDLYTNVNILEKIPSHRRREIDELLLDCNPENCDRFGLGRVTDKRIPGLEAVEKYSKLMVLGKPGSGKTTFLKHLAIQCNKGKFQAHRVPIFIALKQFAEVEGKPSLLEYITQMFSDCDVSADQIAVFLKHGKTLVLLDGLDEVKVEDNSRVIKQVRYFSNKFRTNQFVMTCRIAASNYNFDKFTDVEIADFDGSQIANFAQSWFRGKDSFKAWKFLQQLAKNEPIRELASNPLLLTLLCLVFEESDKFPVNRSELYGEGVDILFKKWDETRKIEREQVYKNLSLQCKKDLLSQIALTTFERGDYFFKQKQLEQYISDYIRNLSDAQNDPEALQLDSEAVLKSIEAQHGLLVKRAQKIYSFSHLTFQEYFTAKRVVECADWQKLVSVSHITDPRWREVFLLMAGMLPNADNLLQLMKHQVDTLVAQDTKLQEFLAWVSGKSSVVSTPYKLSAVRAFYLESALMLDELLFPSFYELDDVFDLTRTLDCRLDNGLNLSRPLFHTLELDSSLTRTLYWAKQWFLPVLEPADLYTAREMPYEHTNGVDCGLASALDCISSHDYELQQLLENLKEQLPPLMDDYSDDDFERIQVWWDEQGKIWVENLRTVMLEYRSIGHDWQFTTQQKELLKRYYEANKLLGDSLNSASDVTDNVRMYIEENLLLPIAEIENKSHNN